MLYVALEGVYGEGAEKLAAYFRGTAARSMSPRPSQD